MQKLTIEGFEYVLEYDDNLGKSVVAILDYRGAKTDIIIPRCIEGGEVIAICKEAFRDKGLKSVVLPDTIRYVGAYAFLNNPITEVVIPVGAVLAPDIFAENVKIISQKLV